MSDYLEFDEEEEGISPRPSKRTKFNEKFDTRYLNVPEDDDSLRATAIRSMTHFVSKFITPRHLVTLLILQAAYTILFLVTTSLSALIFIYFENFSGVSEEVGMKLGNFHDMKIRLFGIFFSVLAIMVELDLEFVNEKITLLKSFIPRSMMLFFVATLSETNPMILYESKTRSLGGYGYGNGYGDDDDLYSNNGSSLYSTNYYSNQDSSGLIKDEIPMLVIWLQSVSSALLKLSVIVYFVFGILCLDQFAPHAFVPVPSRGKKSKKKKSSRQVSVPSEEHDMIDGPNEVPTNEPKRKMSSRRLRAAEEEDDQIEEQNMIHSNLPMHSYQSESQREFDEAPAPVERSSSRRRDSIRGLDPNGHYSSRGQRLMPMDDGMGHNDFV
mmetsp:Transcript_8147/g.8952  ORF Transcript_8147/g.8952 Transcript_8147/m.8952 type:complete len:383 (-) Transcript_8147:205-1353(-)